MTRNTGPVLPQPAVSTAATTREWMASCRALIGACALALSACATAPPTADAPVPPTAAAAAQAPDAAASAANGNLVASSGTADAPGSTAGAEGSGAAVGTPTDPLAPDEPLISEEAARRDLWVRIRRGFAMPDIDTHLVRDRERWYASRPDYVQRMTERGGRYLFHIVQEVEKRGMPTELALLPFIESAFNPQAISSAKASGMWQFIPSTGRHFELRQNIFRDDRRDVLASTDAALDYLQKLHAMFDDWHLALAAYNWGEGSVSRAIARNRKAGLPTDYLSLRMPAETRLYVPKLQAVKNLIADPEVFGLTLPKLENHPYFLAVPIQRDIDTELVSQLSGLPVKEFRELNPSLNKPVILAAGTPQVLLPYDNANLFVHALNDYRGPLASWTAWVVPTTMQPAEAARRQGMTESELREINRIPAGMLVKAGSTLLVPRHPDRHDDVSEKVADNATIQLTRDGPTLRRSTVKARQGDSVASIATRYRVPAARVADWNQVSAGAKFRSGQSVVLYLPPKPGRKTAAAKKPASAKSASTSRRVAASAR